MRIRLWRFFVVFVIVLVGCRAGQENTSVPVAPSSPTISTTEQTPSKKTLEPTNAQPSATARVQNWTVDQVLDTFEAAGLEVGQVRKNNTADLYGAPLLAVEFARFEMPSRGKDAGGIIFSFSSEADLQVVYKYYKDLGWYDSGLYYPWVYIKDNILLQINGILSESEAKKYGDALNSMQ